MLLALKGHILTAAILCEMNLRLKLSAGAEALRNGGAVTTQTIIPIRLVIRMT
jgi:hypothetical protein